MDSNFFRDRRTPEQKARAHRVAIATFCGFVSVVLAILVLVVVGAIHLIKAHP